MQLGVGFTFDGAALKVIICYKQIMGIDAVIHNVGCSPVERGPQSLAASEADLFDVQVNMFFWEDDNNLISFYKLETMEFAFVGQQRETSGSIWI